MKQRLVLIPPPPPPVNLLADGWYRIVAPHYVVGLRVVRGRVVETGPILGWAKDKPWLGVRIYLTEKRYEIEAMP